MFENQFINIPTTSIKKIKTIINNNEKQNNKYNNQIISYFYNSYLLNCGVLCNYKRFKIKLINVYNHKNI